MNYLIRLKRNALTELHFRTKLKRNLTYAIEILRSNVNAAFVVILGRKE